MTLTQYTLASGTNGSAITVGQDGVVAISGTPTPTYTTTNPGSHGSFGMACPATAGTAVAVSWNCAANGSFSVYGQLTTIPGSGSANLITPRNTSSVAAFKIRATASGSHFDLTDAAGSPVATSTISLPSTGTAIRFDCQYSGSTTMTVRVRIFVGANVEGYAPDDTLTASFANSITIARIGLGTQSVTWGATFGGVIRTYDTQYWPVPLGAAAAADTVRPVSVDTNNGWSAVGASTINGALADESDSTYGQSGSAGTTSVIVRLAPLNPPSTATMTLRMQSSTGAATADVQIIEGTTVRQTWAAEPVTTSWANHDFVLDPATIAAVTDWGNVYFSVIYAA